MTRCVIFEQLNLDTRSTCQMYHWKMSVVQQLHSTLAYIQFYALTMDTCLTPEPAV